MAKVRKDTRLKEFWRQNERFADLFNAVVFDGGEVIRAADLEERDTDMSGIIKIKNQEQSLIRTRDVVKKAAYGMEFVILGIENQQKIHYGMPLRTLLYDGLGYWKECRELSKSQEKDRGRTGEEFLSGLKRDDRLHPVITLVVYYGETPWDGPRSLKEMMVAMPEKMERIFADYRMNLVQILDSDQYAFHDPDVQTVFEISREIYRKNFSAIKERYGSRNIKSELAAVIGAITDSAYLLEQTTEKEEIDMCNALKELEEKGRQEGRREMILKLSRKLCAQEIAQLLEIPEEEVQKALQDSGKKSGNQI